MGSQAHLSEITSGPDGNLWFLDRESFGLTTAIIGRITPDGAVAEYPLPMSASGFPVLYGIVAGADGNVWFNLNGGGFGNQLSGPNPGNDRTANITPAGVITVFPDSLGGYRKSITAGPDDDLWVVDPQVGIASVGLDGKTGIPVLPSYPNSGPHYITVGSDHKLWFTEFGGSRIGRMSAIHGSGISLALAGGASFSGEAARFIDGTPTATAADMSATVDWGDGTNSPGAVSGPTGGPFSVNANHVFNVPGNLKMAIKLHEMVDNTDYAVSGRAMVTTPTSTALSSSANPAAPGDMVTFTATVTTGFGQASGTVNFLDFGNLISSAPLNAGMATLTMSSLAAGPHAIVAVYSGDTGYNGSSSAELDEIIQSANQTSTAVVLAPSGTLRFRGPGIMLTATVTPVAGSAGGTVTFYDGDRLLGSTALDAAGQGNVTSAGLTIGANALRAAYSGDNNFGGSISATVVVYRSPRPR